MLLLSNPVDDEISQISVRGDCVEDQDKLEVGLKRPVFLTLEEFELASLTTEVLRSLIPLCDELAELSCLSWNVEV